METKSVITLDPAILPVHEHTVPFSGAEMSTKLEGFAKQDHVLTTKEIAALSYSETAALMGTKPNFSLAKDELVREAKKAQLSALLADALQPTVQPVILTQPTKPIEVVKVPEKKIIPETAKKDAVKPTAQTKTPELDFDALAKLTPVTSTAAKIVETDVAPQITDSRASAEESVAVREFDAIDIKDTIVAKLVAAKEATVRGGHEIADFAGNVMHKSYDKVRTSHRLRKIGAVALSLGVVSLAVSAIDSLNTSTTKKVDATVETATPTTYAPTTEVTVAETTPQTTIDAVTTTTVETVPSVSIAPTTTQDTTTTTITAVPETTVAPRPLTLMEEIVAGKWNMETELAGNKIGTLSIDGICLSEIDVSIWNGADPVKYPQLMNGFDWTVFNNDPTLPPVAEGDFEAARERINPLYRVRPAENAQEACDMADASEYEPRWTRNTKGSDAAESYQTPGELTPQTTFHPHTVLPGQDGVTYIEGHRTTESAPFVNLDALTPGQSAVFSDGATNYNYTFVRYETVSPQITIDEINNRAIAGKNTLILSTCDEGSSVRLMAIFALDSVQA